jgi:hypothetical protein
MRRGLVTLVPDRALRLFTWKELETEAVGVEEIDVALIKRHTTYHGYAGPNDRPCARFFRVLEGFGNDDRAQFLQFVWGRSRLPRESAWPRPFKLTRKTDVNMLPIAHTCFFQLELPPYSTDKEMKEKLLTAIWWGSGEFLIR